MRASRHPCSDAEHADELRRLLWKRRALRGRQVHQPVCSPESLWDVSFLDVERRGDARHHLHEPLAARGGGGGRAGGTELLAPSELTPLAPATYPGRVEGRVEGRGELLVLAAPRATAAIVVMLFCCIVDASWSQSGVLAEGGTAGGGGVAAPAVAEAAGIRRAGGGEAAVGGAALAGGGA
eukprot:CAMPEP_0196684374 /NCGR_PEP_ID=MMETSP1090-20130531/10514_1 /TAXON_ID=37098 /ORGANISM="Isochrysis sp, Strain CCMP1244" /LENGTH=180 /DNA_ID=CAMNT_0042022853 /DNA_START=262 /DNA_END=802 /DNA_ORIENTATION=-